MRDIPLTPTPRASRPVDTRPMHQRLLPEGVERRPEWLTVKLPAGEGYSQVKSLMRGLDLVTVCEEARCPNIAECWGHGTATFMILGEVCTRACAFCGRPPRPPRLRPRAVRGDDPSDPPPVAWHHDRGAHAGLQRQPLVAAGGDGDGAGDLQPQPRDDRAAVRAGAAQGRLPAEPDAAPGGQADGAAQPDEERAHAGPRRGDARGAAAAGGPARPRRGDRDHRAVPAAVAQASPAGAVLDA